MAQGGPQGVESLLHPYLDPKARASRRGPASPVVRWVLIELNSRLRTENPLASQDGESLRYIPAERQRSVRQPR